MAQRAERKTSQRAAPRPGLSTSNLVDGGMALALLACCRFPQRGERATKEGVEKDGEGIFPPPAPSEEATKEYSVQ